MAQETIGQNITFEIYNADGTLFNGLVLHKSTFESVVMSLGDKITGDVYYPTNALIVTMQEYIVYKGVKYSLVNPPTIVREGMASDNSELKGMTKYSFTFYHPMYMLANFPFSDVAVSSDQQRYLSENKTFYWIGNLVDYVAKLNKNLEGTEWCVEIGTTVPLEERTKLSEVLSFDKQTIADALKTGYETWEVPYVIDTIASTDSRYLQGKRFLVHFGLPSEEILVENEQHELVPFVFHFGQGVGLKNNSRTPRNNKIVTRISGYGSEDNIPYGYPQILWTGDQSWNFTINNDSDDPHSYPIYDGIMNGEPVRLIKHPFTRSTLMPSIYSDTVNRKVNPYATGYDPTIELKDYYDADNTYENPINPLSPSCEIHGFEKIKPELGQKSIIGVAAYSDKDLEAISLASFLNILDGFHTESEFTKEKEEIDKISSTIGTMQSNSGSVNTRSYYCNWSFTKDERYAYVKFDSNSINFEYTVLMVSPSQSVEWDDSMDGDGNYKQSYFKITLPQLDFDLYACAAITQDMKINMRSGACLGCSFSVAVDWEDYKANFYDKDGDFAPQGSQRDFEKYPNSLRGSITLVVQKDIDTFGTLMPNRYQKPTANDEFVILGISLPYTYVVAAEERLDDDMKQYMRDNNVYHFDYPLKFDEHFLATHTGILEQMKPNIVVRFDYVGTTHALYIKQMSVKWGQSPLPQYDITLTDDVEIVLNQIGRVTDEVSHLRVLLGQGGGSVDLSALDQRYLSKISDDKAKGLITFIRGLQVGENFVSGLLGEGGMFRRDADGTTYLETDKLYVRMRAYFDTVEVKRYIHSGGNRIASKAGIKCTRVEYIDENGDVTNDADDAVKFRCYFRANDNGITITNDFVVNDLAFCKETNVDTESINQHGYWRKVVGVGDTVSDKGELYIDLSATDCQNGSDIPIAQDDIIQLGNTTDTTRQGAIIEYVGGVDAPAYQIYQGINSYSLNNKNYVRFGYDSQYGGAQAYIGNPDGSTYLWYHNVTENGVTFPKLEIKANVAFTSPITHQETTIEDFATAITNKTEDLQRQIDGEIESWFYAGVPTLLNAPANTWDTTEKKDKHLGDLYYDKNTGYGYRFVYDNDYEVYAWTQIYDDALVEALRLANEAQDTADHKRRVFLTTPTPPYDAGDLWVNAVWPASGASQGATYNNDILKCVTPKTDSESFAVADWTKASKYTDDSQFETYISQILNGTNEQTDPAVVAQALHVIKGALNQDTNIVGGLMLTTLIGMRDGNGTLWGGMNGQYNANAHGGGLAAWYGGGMIDKYNPTTHQFDVQNGARIGFRFDGSGYVAGGAIAWDATGLTNLNVSSITAATINLGGKDVATQEWVGNNYISIAYFDRLFRAYNGDNLVNHNDTQSTINNIKAMFSFWTDAYLAALGNSSGSGVSLTLANMGDVQLSTPTNGQALIYNASTQKWTNQTISAMGNYLPLTGGTLIGDLLFAGYNNRVFGIKRTSSDAGTSVGTNIDVGWDWENRDGSGAFFRSSDADDRAGDFGFFARNATQLCELLGKPDGTLTWGNANVLTSANVKTINGQSIYGTGNISVGGTGGDADTVDGYHASSLGIIYTYSIPASGCVRITFSDRFAAIISVRKTNQDGGLILIGNGYGANRIRNTWTQLSPTTSLRWSVPASDSIDKAIEIQNNSSSGARVEVTMLNSAVPTFSSVSSLYSTGKNIPIATADSNVASATKLETSRSLWGQSFDGTADVSGAISNAGNITPSANASYNLGSSSLWWNRIYTRYIDTASGYNLRLCVAGTERMTITTSGNVGIGTTSPSYKLHVNGTIGAGNITGANLDSEGYISALSDIRKKDVVEYMDGLTIEQIAEAPIIKFTWIDRPEDGLQVGSIAQYWEKVLPQSVHTTPKGFLSFAESRAALVGTISNSRELVKHEKRIAELERENKELKMKLENVAKYGI